MINYLENLQYYIPNKNQISIQYGGIKESEDTVHFVNWSGGCDSSLLLYELLNHYGSDKVIAVSYDYPWLHSIKAELEESHRNSFKAKLKLRGDNLSNFKHMTFEIKQHTINGDDVNVNLGGLPQSVAWLMQVPMYAKSGSIIYSGIINGDCLNRFISQYYNLFNSISTMIDRDLVLKLPYLCLNKTHIIEKLFHYNIYEETWFCENPPAVGKMCNYCTPCTTHISALYALQFSGTNDFIKTRAKQELEKIEKKKE